MSTVLRDAAVSDHPRILELNNDALPAVSELTMGSLVELIAETEAVWVAETDGEVSGFIILMEGPGKNYESLNYAWFSEHFDAFLYVDRIVIAPAFQGDGVGRAIYESAITYGADRWPVLLAEVNIKPRNDQSLAFHDRLGFEEVGQQDTDGGAKRVSMLRRSL